MLFAFVLLALNVSAQWWKPQHHLYDTVEYVVMYELTLREDTTHLEYSRTDDYMLSIGKNNIISSFRGYNSYRRDMERKKLGDEGVLLEQMQTGQYHSKYLPSVLKFDIFKEYEKKNSYNDRSYIFLWNVRIRRAIRQLHLADNFRD